VTDDLADRARRDPLTGLLNHLAFHARVAEEVARTRRYRGRASLVLLDLDDFKATNDRAGHLEGDRLLRVFAAGLGASVRANDAAGRVGGDEFGVLLVQADERAASAFVERLRTRLPAPLAVSAGSAQLAEAAVSAERLFALADRRLYEAKSLRAA
jgi:diguanylate cyclase (GGDEF)-like protein